LIREIRQSRTDPVVVEDLSRLDQIVSVRRLLGLRFLLLKQIQERAQLQPWDVGPPPAQLHVLKEFEQGAALGGKTGSKRPVLDGAMQLLEITEKGQQHLGLVPVGRCDSSDLGQERLELLFQSGNLRREA
jgi:hypothetical protein